MKLCEKKFRAGGFVEHLVLLVLFLLQKIQWFINVLREYKGIVSMKTKGRRRLLSTHKYEYRETN